MAFDESRYTATAGFQDPEAVLLEKIDSKVLHQAIEDLPYEFRETLILRELEGLSYKQIATVVGAPLGTVMSRLSRARKELQRRLCEAPQEAQP